MAICPSILEVKGPTPDTSFRIELQIDKNANLIANLVGMIPLDSFLLHVVVAGETFYMPTPSLALIPQNMVERKKGSVYYNVTGQSICFCYGIVTESTHVNQLGTVLEEDIGNLVNLGNLVYQETCSAKVPTIIKLTLDLPNSSNTNGHASSREPLETKSAVTNSERPKSFDGSWQSAKENIDFETAQLRCLVEPDDIQLIRLGATGARAGREETALQPIVILQGFLATLGPHIITRLMAISKDDDMTLPLVVRITRAFLTQTFNHFEFLDDCGLKKVHDIGDMYNRGLESVQTLDEYRKLTDSMRSMIQLLFRWVHLVFPWYLKNKLECNSPEEALKHEKLAIYQPPY